MTEAVFDFAAINRRLNRKPEPVAAVAAVAECGAANRNGEIDPTHFADAWRYANSRNQCQQLQGVVDRAYTRQIEALRASLDETETVFIGWDVECQSSS
jgi:hypothetical protein